MSADPKSIGARLRSERKARRLTVDALAEAFRDRAGERDRRRMPKLRDLSRMIRGYEAGEHVPGPRYRMLYAAVFDVTEDDLFGAPAASSAGHSPSPAHTAVELAAWIEGTNVGEATLTFLDQETRRLAFDYARRRPGDVIAEASGLLQQATRLLREGRQRLAQTRALFRNASELLALLCLLAGDVGHYPSARAYGFTAWMCAEEAASDLHRAHVLSAQSKTAKWEERYRDAADLARRGYECSPPAEARILLASQEANALQALGDLASAREALTRAQRARDGLSGGDAPGSAWACPRPRQATYALQVALGAGDPARMLREASAADEAWSEGDPWVYGTWSQIRIGAGIAHAMAGQVEGAAEEVAPVLELPPELRVVTITGRIGAVEQHLARRRYSGSSAATDLIDQIRDFRAMALPQRQITSSEDA